MRWRASPLDNYTDEDLNGTVPTVDTIRAAKPTGDMTCPLSLLAGALPLPFDTL